MEAITPAVRARRPALEINANAVLAVVAVAQFMVILDSTVVNVALPTIRIDLGFSEQNLRLSRPSWNFVTAVPV